jgi:hypothetical protein
MTILEELRERKDNISYTSLNSIQWDLFNAYDLALENALLKLKNRGVEIKDLKWRLKEAEPKAEAWDNIKHKFNS